MALRKLKGKEEWGRKANSVAIFWVVKKKDKKWSRIIRFEEQSNAVHMENM